MWKLTATAALILLATARVAAQQSTLQQQFDAASEALRAERWQDALDQFEAIEARVNNPRTIAIVGVRKAEALLRLGRFEEARATLQQNLAQLPASDVTLDEDRFVGLLTLGEIEEASLDYTGALRHYRAAKAVPVDTSLRLSVYRGLIQTQMFENAPAALAEADEALALARSVASTNQNIGVVRTLRGRVLLNMGRHSEARGELRTAMERLGGLTSRVNLADIVARSDLAIAAMLSGRSEDARRYLAYTGAGHHETSFSPSSGTMHAPPCGGELRPDDIAVLEFSVRDDGTVGHVTPVYASRQGGTALAFARAARAWGWSPDAFDDVPLLFRLALRVEVRCSLRPAGVDSFRADDAEDARRWYAAHNIPTGEERRLAPLLQPAGLRAELERRQAAAGGDSPTLLEPLVRLARHPGVGAEETAQYLRRALPVAARADAPGSVIAALAIHLANAERNLRGRRGEVDWAALLAHPTVRADARATAAIRLHRAATLYSGGEDREAAALIAEIRQTAALPPEDPVLLDLAALEVAVASAREDGAAARAAYEAMGAAAEPCRVSPRLRRPSTSGRDFPDEAMRWGFEGWAEVEWTPDRQGNATRARTVLAYPPFVFDESAERVGNRLGLEPTYLPDERTCPPVQSNILFRIQP